ncbi:MAG: acetylglutamate kinase [Thermodesulfobacteriota bacterium]
MKKKIEKIKTLFEALPYIKRFSGKTIVIKYGGSAMTNEELRDSFARDVVLMKYVGLNPVIVHGGGPQIGEALAKLGKKSRFVRGIRVTDDETMRVVDRVLVGKVNKEIVRMINGFDGKAVGIAGKDGGFIIAKPLTIEGEDMGHVGEVSVINPSVIDDLDERGFIPVVAPVGACSDGRLYNINADTVAGELASALKAEKLILLTDVKGVLDKRKKLISTLTLTKARELIKDKTAVGGMVPKIKCCLGALNSGVTATHIIDGRLEHAVLLEIFTDEGIGTIISKRKGKAQ